MIRTAIIFAAFALQASTAVACTMPQTSCTPPGGGQAYLDGSVGSVVLFSEVVGLANGDQQFSYVVAECNSRSALSITRPENAGDAYWDAEGLIYNAVFDDAPQTLPNLSRQIERLGVPTTLGQLPADHCGCDLPNMPTPEFNCPVDF